MDNLDSWWDFDSGISIESNDDESEESTSLPIFLGLERHPSNARYAPSIPSVSEMDHGMVVVGALAVMSVMLVLLISVGLVVYMKILRRRTTTINLGNLSEVYQTTTRPRAAYTSAKESDRRISTFSRREEPTLGALFTRCLDGEKGDFLPPLFVWASLPNEFVPGAK